MEKYFNSIWLDNSKWQQAIVDTINKDDKTSYQVADLNFEIVATTSHMGDLFGTVLVTLKEN